MTTSSRAAPVLDGHAAVAEGPVWDPVSRTLLWVDGPAGAVHHFDPATGLDVVQSVGQLVGAVVWRRSGGLALALRDGFAVLDPDATAPQIVAAVERDRHETWMNDGACDRAGRFWAGTAARIRDRGTTALYRLDPDRSLHRMVAGIRLSNGIGWSPDDRLLYYVDSPTQGLDVFDFDLESGAVGDRRRLVDVDPAIGTPDGLAVDAEGCIWLAVWGSGRVWRYTPDGRLDRVVVAPVTQVTSCAFGGVGLDQLYITSAADGLSSAERRAEPLAGGVFRVDPGVLGLPPQGYDG